jgi:prolyl-tRNA editing enzyme YbaK/EbsC (Cys-tRNA(Pro) deacylase)
MKEQAVRLFAKALVLASHTLLRQSARFGVSLSDVVKTLGCIVGNRSFVVVVATDNAIDDVEVMCWAGPGEMDRMLRVAVDNEQVVLDAAQAN